MNETKRQVFINFLKGSIEREPRGERAYNEVLTFFEGLFPEPTIPVRPYNHELENGAARLGVNEQEMSTHPEIREFDTWLHSEIDKTWKQRTKAPRVSIVIEKVEGMNIPERVKLILTTNVTSILMRLNTHIAEREQVEVISAALAGVKSTEKALEQLNVIKQNQQKNDNPEPPNQQFEGSVPEDKRGA